MYGSDMSAFLNDLFAASSEAAPNKRPSVKGKTHDSVKKSRKTAPDFRPMFNPMLGLPPVKRVIVSGPKTIVLWGDGTKTIVSCGETEIQDTYAGFCAAVVKKIYGSTTRAKKVLNLTLADPHD